MPLCARIFELNFSRLSSLDHVLHKYQRREFLALAGMSLFVHAIARNSVRPQLYSRATCLDPVLQTHQRCGFLALAGRQHTFRTASGH